MRFVSYECSLGCIFPIDYTAVLQIVRAHENILK